VKSRSDDYKAYSFDRLSDGSIQITIAVNELQLQPYITFTGNFGGDSVSGQVRWGASITRGPPTHIGRFVARRRK
jgi:hypothetical protein